MNAAARLAEVRALRRRRPRDRFLRGSLTALSAFVLGAWWWGDFGLVRLFASGRFARIGAFLRDQVAPAPLREGEGWGAAAAWAAEAWRTMGYEAAWRTLAIALAAMALAGVLAACVAPLASGALMTCDPFVPNTRHSTVCHVGWVVLRSLARLGAVLMRAVPEYVWAFLLLGLLGPTAWPAVLALAVHNGGILGRLGADTFENVPSGVPAALRSLGADRRQLLFAALLPTTFPRHLLFFFYRLETCVREATVLGMLGIVSLGYWVMEARARFRYDEMVFLVLLGVVLVLLADVASHLARRFAERSGPDHRGR